MPPPMEFLQLLTPTDVWNIFTHVITVGLIAITAFWLDGYRTKLDRDNKLNEWIKLARNERDSKEHKVLTEESVDPSKILTAKEVKEKFLAKELDLPKHVSYLAKRCRQYNGDRSWVNAIAEELYDEVR